MKKFEISSNLEDCENIDVFKRSVNETRDRFLQLFGAGVLDRLPLFVDNSTQSGGYTPMTFVAMDSFVFIKLCIADFTKREQTIYQCAHEMTHFVYRCLIGLNKKRANVYEESMCSAMSLCFLYGNCVNFEKWCEHVKGLKNEGYRKGYDVAQKVAFDPFRLRDKLLAEVAEYKKIAGG